MNIIYIKWRQKNTQNRPQVTGMDKARKMMMIYEYQSFEASISLERAIKATLIFLNF